MSFTTSKKIFNIIITLFTFFILFVADGCNMKNQNNTSTLNNKDSSIVLTAEKITRLKSTVNDPNGDYYIQTPEKAKKLVEAFVADNSKGDAVALYLASGTAIRQNMLKEAGFLFFAAQLRKHFDYGRFGMGQANGNNIQTYLGFLNETEGEAINSAILINPEAFCSAINMIQKWNAIPSDDAVYPKETYGTYALPKDKWQAIADSDKKSFMEEFADPQLKILKDPKGLEALIFMKDYNSGKIKRSEVNDKKYEEYSTFLQAFYEKH